MSHEALGSSYSHIGIYCTCMLVRRDSDCKGKVSLVTLIDSANFSFHICDGLDVLYVLAISYFFSLGFCSPF